MTCDEIERELVGYHFATLEDAPSDSRRPASSGSVDRRRVEEHLVSCAACVRAFVEIKRAIETSEEAPAPSPAARAKLRHAVARELDGAAADGKSPTTKRADVRRTWWERPLAIALAASVVLVSGAAMHALTQTSGSPPYALQHAAR